MSRVKVSISEKIFFIFRMTYQRTFLPIDSDSDFISKRVPRIRSCTKHLSRFYRLGHPKYLAAQRCSRESPRARMGPRAARRSAGRFPADHTSTEFYNQKISVALGVRQLQIRHAELRSRNIIVPSCRPSQRSG